MDVKKESATENKARREGLFSKLKYAVSIKAKEKSNDTLKTDLLVFAVGFILSRCHILFGAHPLGIAYTAAISRGAWSALMGVVIGSVTMGGDGIIFAASALITLLLRAVMSDGGAIDAMFSERMILKACSSVIGGFVAMVYEMALSGINERSLLFGITMLALPPVIASVFSGALSSEISLSDIFSPREILSFKGRSRSEKQRIVYFQMSLLSLGFFIGLSLGEVDLFGISASYIFSGFVTLAVAKRFGAIYALAAGFVCSLGVSGAFSVSFALLGLCAGAMFRFGSGYAVLLGGAAMSAWSIYYAGLSGFLTTLPEYLISAALAAPLLGRLSPKRAEEEGEDGKKAAEDMVGTMALAFQNRYSGSLDSLECALSALSEVVRGYAPAAASAGDEYRDIAENAASRFCRVCPGGELCTNENISPCTKNTEKIIEKLMKDERILPSDINTDTEFCQIAAIVAEEINREAGLLKMKRSTAEECYAEEYGLVSMLINEARQKDSLETEVDGELSERLYEAVLSEGLTNGVIRVFGKRRKRFILAGEDSDGSKISSRALKDKLESISGVRLGEAEYFRRGDMALMECGVRRALSAASASASLAGSEREVSGDSCMTFESVDDFFYSVISDGMGSGAVAKETSSFAVNFMKCALNYGASKEAVLRLINHIIRSGGSECSATADIFELDLLSGEGEFLKSGAASSFVKRDTSIFRIRSRTAPIGLMKTIDAERIRVEIKPGDYVIMISDGVADASDDAPWLLEALSRDACTDLREYAEMIISEAKKNEMTRDDMSVTVIRISEA